MKVRVLFLLAGVIASLSFHSVSYGQTRFTSSMTTAQVIPAPVVMKAPTGTAVFTLRGDAASGFELKYDITVTNLTGPIVAARFHQGVPGVVGSAVKDIKAAFTGNTASGTWRSVDEVQPLTPELVGALRNGELYMSIHTDANGTGEMRGQVYPSMTFVARLDALQEVVPATVVGKPAGTAYFTLRGLGDGGAELAYDITVDGLTGPITVAHFRNGAPGAEGARVNTITQKFGGGNTASSVWRSVIQTDPLTPDALKALLKGEIYVNICTGANPGGEIRGQIVPE
jgi:hypothetical protein